MIGASNHRQRTDRHRRRSLVPRSRVPEAANAGDTASSYSRPLPAPGTRAPMLSCDERTAGGASWRSANRLSTHRDLDDKHGAAAAATDEGRRWRYGAFVVRSEEHTSELQSRE